jgi:hypothetical protein
MTCHCSSSAEHASRAVDAERSSNSVAILAADRERKATDRKIAELETKLAARSASTTNYSIERVERTGRHLVMQVRYPNCEHRAYEGLKTMVFLNVTEAAALRWRSIDPHFRGRWEPKTELLQDVIKRQAAAPSPDARFPGDPDGWTDALVYARGKDRP